MTVRGDNAILEREVTLSKMIDSLCDMSKVVNGSGGDKGKNQEADAE